MPWILIVRFLIAFPAMIDLVKQIIKLIGQISGNEAMKSKADLIDVLASAVKSKTMPASGASKLEALRDQLLKK